MKTGAFYGEYFNCGGRFRQKISGRKFNLIIPICQEICYNIGLYQALFVGTQQKGVDCAAKI
jgi:hypothetical protein